MDNEAGYYHAILDKEESGLPYDIWLDSTGAATNSPDKNPSVWISSASSLISVSILNGCIDGRVYADEVLNVSISLWIEANRDTLLRHWYKQLSDKEALNILCTLASPKTTD